jgi:hypothetical protein
MARIICAICHQEGSDLHTVRESWTQAGGWGSIPDAAIVHPACDRKEQRLLKSGRLKLSDIFVPVKRGNTQESHA